MRDIKIKLKLDTKNPDRVNFPDISINAAEELARFSKKLETKFKNVKELSELILTREFTDYPKYYYSFVEAYFETYPGHEYEKIKKNHKSHILDTYHNLRYYEDLEKDELSKLITFCVTLGSYVSSEEVDEIRNQGPCFR